MGEPKIKSSKRNNACPTSNGNQSSIKSLGALGSGGEWAELRIRRQDADTEGDQGGSLNDVTTQGAVLDALGRRIKTEGGQGGRVKVTNSGDLDGTTVYYWNRQQIVETRDGSGNLETQVYHGTRYIDEVVGQRLPAGRVYVHQDANWNVTDVTDLTARSLERNYYNPYGQLEVVRDRHPFDYDDDGDVDDTDIAAATSGGECWNDYELEECRRLDADSDRDIDADDYDTIVAYVDILSTDTELQRIPTTTSSRLGNTFAHQGLVLDPELDSYQNRARQYAPKAKRFMHRDPLVLGLRTHTPARVGNTSMTLSLCNSIALWNTQLTTMGISFPNAIEELRALLQCPGNGPSTGEAEHSLVNYERCSPLTMLDPSGESPFSVDRSPLDAWSLVHCGSGWLGGAITGRGLCLITCTAGIIWEFEEKDFWSGWNETLPNQITDAVLVCACCLLNPV